MHLKLKAIFKFINIRLDSCDVIKMEVNNNKVSDGDPKIEDLMSLKTLLPAEIPEVGDNLEVLVTYAVSPDNFVIVVNNTEGDKYMDIYLI